MAQALQNYKIIRSQTLFGKSLVLAALLQLLTVPSNPYFTTTRAMWSRAWSGSVLYSVNNSVGARGPRFDKDYDSVCLRFNISIFDLRGKDGVS